MKNYIQKKARYLKALMLTLVVGLFAFSGYAQTFPISTPPPAPWYAGQEATVTYEATGFDPGTTFIVWDDADGQFDIDEGETIYGSSTAQDASTDIDFNWGTSGGVNLKLAGFSGSTVTGEILNFEREDVTVIGTTVNSTSDFIYFDRASSRSLTTDPVDINTTEKVVLEFFYEGTFGNNPDTDNPIEVLYSTDGFATAGTALTEDNLSVAEFEDINQVLSFTLPTAAKSATTSFKIRQKGTVDYGTGKNWRVRTGTFNFGTINVEIGETYSLIANGFQNFDNVLQNQIIIDDLLDAADASATVFYPGDEVTIDAQLPNVDLTGLSFVATIVNNNTGAEYLLDSQTTPVKDNGTKDINVNGTIPTDLEYYTAGNGWDFRLQAYEGASPLLGVNEFADFRFGIPADYTSTTTQINSLRGIRFDEAGERSLLTPEFNITSTDGTLTLSFQRRNSNISPADTDLILEYTTDGTTFTELTSIGINELIYDVNSNNYSTFEIDSWPAGVVSSSTQFRVRQEGNNGAGLDGWYFRDFDVVNESNIVSNATINEALAAFTMPRPEITADNIEVGGDGLAFAMEDLTYTYAIDEGAFPAGTSAQLLLDRAATGPDADIIIGTVADITTGEIAFTVPPIVADDYDVYMRTSNGENYGFVTLSIYDTELTITNITYENPVTIAGEDFGTPGSGITVEYTLLGSPGASAEMMLSIEDDAASGPDDFQMIAASNTINGTITGTLPTNFDYSNPPNLKISLGNGGIYSNSPFDEEIYEEFFYSSDPIPASVTLEGNSPFNGRYALTAAGQRSITTEAFSLPYGGQIQTRYYFYNYNFIPQDILLQGSTDGTNWIDIDTRTISGNQSFAAWDVTLPNTVWSENTQLRIIYNENGSNGFETNIFAADRIRINAPEFLETSSVEANFNVIIPTLSVDTNFDPYTSYVGQEFTANYNAIGFAAGTEFAVVIEQGNQYYVAGSSAVQGAGSVTFTMPITLPIDSENPNDDYDLFIYPYLPATAGDMYAVGQFIDVDTEEDFLINTGDIDTDEDYFEMAAAGKREILTRAFDLSSASSATLYFDYYLDDDFEITANKNTVPRLEVSIDGGATFQTINVEDLAPGEMAMYDEGLLYEDDEYDFGIEIPSEFLTAATHFRWSQPLNLGAGLQVWEVENIEIELNGGNALNDDVYDEDNTEFTDIEINSPDLNDYTWAQADLQDAVFNGETFDYSWNYNAGLDATTAEVFPAGTEFIFSLNGEIDPETGENLIIGTSTALGVAEASVPFYVSNGVKQVNVTAVIEVDGVEYFYYEDEPLSGSLEVFNQVLNTTFSGNANEVYYAGNAVTVDYAFENNVTTTALANLQYNLILDYNGNEWLLAVDDAFTGSFTVDMPPFVKGNVDFEVRASVGGPLGVVGEILETSGIGLLDDEEDWINDEVALDQNFDLPGTSGLLNDVSGRRVLTSTDFDLVAANAARLSFNLAVSDVGFNQIDINNVLEDQQLIFEYSVDGGASYTELEAFFTEGDQNDLVPYNLSRNYILDAAVLTDATRFRFRQEESRFTIYIEDMQIVGAGEAKIDYVSASDNGFTPTIKEQSLQITAIDGEAACISDEVTLDYEIRGKFGADNLVSVMLGDDNAFFTNVPSNTVTAFGANNNNTEVVGSFSFGSSLDFYGQTFRYAYTQSYDLSGYGSGALTASVFKFFGGGSNPFNEEILVYYSTDGGSSFTEFGSIVSGGNFTFDLPQAALVDDVIFRLEQPYSGGNRFNDQDRWRFDGLTIEASNISIDDAYVFNITEGSGSISFELPASAVAAGDNNQLFKFRLEANDDTYEAIGEDYVVTGTYTETSLEVVAPINENASFSVADPLACSAEDVIVSINAGNMQDYFLYEILDGAGTVLGSLERDPLDPQNEINIGQVPASTDLQLRVTSQSSTGTVCNTLITDEDDVEVLENFELYSQLNVDQGMKLVTAGTEYATCAGGATTITLSVRRLLENGSTVTGGTVEWFRDNVNNLVATGSSINDAGAIDASGAYFARVSTGTCIYTTESIQINLVETPAQPTVTVVSGDLTACESAEPVVLQAPEGFAYYTWNTGAKTRTITVESSGSYNVQVSNVAGGSCLSPSSANVDVTRYAIPEFAVYTNSKYIGAGEVVNSCSSPSQTIFLVENGSFGNTGLVQVIKDGENYATVQTGSNNIALNESGVYSFVWSFNSLNVEGCSVSSVEFTLNLNDVADVTPEITVTGDLNSCDPENVVTLEGPAGFANYVWSRNGTALIVNASSITVAESGAYTLRVSNSDLSNNCGLSASSNSVVYNAAPEADDYSINVNGSFVAANAEVEVCEETDITISGLNGETVKWFRDGAEITPTFASNNRVSVSQSGVYNAEVQSGACVVATYSVTVTVIDTPDAQVLASTGALSFCEGEGTVTLTAPTGFDYYTWRRGNTVMNSNTNGFANSNVIEVSTAGDYTVAVSNSATACQSVRSNVITVDVVTEPNLPNLFQVNTTCGDGVIEFTISNNNNSGSAMTYQLYNGETGQASGSPVTIQGNQSGSIFTDVVTEDGTPFYVEVMYADGTGCSYMDPSVFTNAFVRTITLEVSGATLTATYPTGNVEDLRWFRNGVLLSNANSRSITISDAAEYSIEVEYTNGCVLTSSSADLGRVLAVNSGASMDVNTYPNPTVSDFTVSITSEYMGLHKVVITTLTGQVMKSESFDKSSLESKHEISIASLQSGMYNMQIQYDGIVKNVRIIKK